MFRNYLKISFRSLSKNKIFSIINIAGLSLSIAVFILIAVYAHTELTINKFHKNYAGIYKIGKYTMPAPVADIVKLNHPELNKIARIDGSRSPAAALKYNNKLLTIKKIIYADPAFFDVFSFKGIKGNLKTALNDDMSLVLTKSEAKRIFGNENPLNKTVKFDNDYELTIKAVIDDLPANSSMQFNYVISFSSIERMVYSNDHPFDWFHRNYETYVVCPDKWSRTSLEKEIKSSLKNVIPQNVVDLNIDLCSLQEIYYTPELSGFHSHGSAEKNFTLISIAVLILLIAVINYVNLSTAHISVRTREIGVRKTIGATRFTLIKQFLTESVFVTIISMIIGVLLASELMPVFNNVIGFNLSLFSDYIFAKLLILLTGGILLGIISGIYPAFYLTSLKPGLILRGGTRQGSRKAVLRKTLMTLQFSITVVLIVSTLLINKQSEFIRNKPLGFQKENLIYFPVNKEVQLKADLFQSKIKIYPDIKDFAFTSSIPGEMDMVWGQTMNYAGKDFQIWFAAVPVSCDFIRVMGMKLIEGRDFIDKDQNDIANVIINEAFAKRYGLTEPLKAHFASMGEGRGNIVGVVKDFNFKSLHSQVEPLAFFNFPGWYGNGLIKINSTKYSDIKEVINHLKTVWTELSPDFPLEYSFLDERLNQQYIAEERFEKIFISSSLLAIFIACLGLFGLAAFTAEQRTKEIGIRKVLGASVSEIITLLSKDYAKLIILANLAAWPAAYYFLSKWLQDFAYKAEISWWMFAFAGAIVIAIALITVSVLALKAATANPVESLKYE